MRKRLFAVVAAVAGMLGSGALAQDTQPSLAPAVKADAVEATATSPAPQEDVQALRQEISQLRAELDQLRSQKPAGPIKADPAQGSSPRVMSQPAEEVTKTLPTQPRPVQQPVVQQMPAAEPAPAPVATLPPYANVQVSAVKVSSTRRRGAPGLSVSADVTLDGVPNVPFIFQAVLVTPDEQIHTDARSNPYIATREVRTGDNEDTDDYGVFLDLENLFSSRPPEELFVQVRILDMQGQLVAKSGLHSFRRPWQ